MTGVQQAYQAVAQLKAKNRGINRYPRSKYVNFPDIPTMDS